MHCSLTLSFAPFLITSSSLSSLDEDVIFYVNEAAKVQKEMGLPYVSLFVYPT